MRQELYINGQAVELASDTAVTLQFRSNLLSDIDKITSSNSLTIQLPKTPRNNLALGFADVPYSQGIERRWYDATYIRNGVPMINGKAALLSSKRDSYEVCLTWGVIEYLQEWLDAGTTLRDLPLSATVQLKQYDIDVFSKVTGIPYGYLYYNNMREKYVFPVVQVRTLFDLIRAEISLMNIDTSAVNIDQLNDYYINITEDLVKELVNDTNIEPTFSVVDYLPDIKQVEFFKSICHLFGWYIERKPTGGLRLVSFNTLSQNSNAIDWSNKLASGAIPEEVEYKYTSYAQRNWMRYKEDENVTLDADGYIAVDDETLDVDNTLFTLPFAPTDGGNIIEQYVTIYDSEGVAETDFIKTQPRILKAVDNGPLDSQGNVIPMLDFVPELRFVNVITNRYGYYQAVMRKPLIISVELRLNEFDLLGLDYTRPIYFEQYGNRFAIIEIQNQGELSTAKLIKLI